MKSIADSDKFFNHEIEYHTRKRIELQTINPKASQNHQDTEEWFILIRDFVQKKLADSQNQNPSLSDDDIFHLDPLDLDELPEELVSELSVSVSDTQDAQLLELLDIGNRPLNLNELLIASHRKHGMTYKRAALTARLYRLISSGKVQSPSKGIYELVSDSLGNSADDEDINTVVHVLPSKRKITQSIVRNSQED